MKTTNYINTFIAVADDCKATEGKIPPLRADHKTVANFQFEMIAHHPYQYTSDDVIYATYKIKQGNTALSRDEYFSTGKACLRTSPLAKTYGWGIHANENGKVAVYEVNSEKYFQLQNDTSIVQTKAMRSKREKY
ncbi:DUF6157 family protein [Zhouia sp. PK063]|uniref:DUF6157 family protein n=1 Tax=Zhouia sp. PK063 TaxID=3373602 RepID=UPI0037A83CAC